VGLMAASLSHERVTAKQGVLYGTVGGLLGGTVATGFVHFAPRPATDEPPSEISGGPSGPGPWGVEQWFPNFGVAPDPTRPEAPPRLMLGVQGTLR
jgi:hypothetical protein